MVGRGRVTPTDVYNVIVMHDLVSIGLAPNFSPYDYVRDLTGVRHLTGADTLSTAYLWAELQRRWIRVHTSLAHYDGLLLEFRH